MRRWIDELSQLVCIGAVLMGIYVLLGYGWLLLIGGLMGLAYSVARELTQPVKRRKGKENGAR